MQSNNAQKGNGANITLLNKTIKYRLIIRPITFHVPEAQRRGISFELSTFNLFTIQTTKPGEKS
jgi:hypothetical protein